MSVCNLPKNLVQEAFSEALMKGYERFRRTQQMNDPGFDEEYFNRFELWRLADNLEYRSQVSHDPMLSRNVLTVKLSCLAASLARRVRPLRPITRLTKFQLGRLRNSRSKCV